MHEDVFDPLETAEDSVDVEAVALDALQHEAFMKALWPEICELPVKQRRAFLLHLEIDEAVAFIQYGCCSLRQMADVVDMPAEDFAAQFSKLPLPDERIAVGMGATGRQVINLRKCARERLGRRLKTWTDS